MGFDLFYMIKTFGYVGIFAAIFFESGIPLLFFLPGDTLLLTAGFLASQGYLEIELLLIGGLLSAVGGYMLGYHLGYGIGGKTFELNQSRYFKPEHIEKTRHFFAKYGNISVLLARFLPLRGCVSFLAGATRMPYRTFMIYNVLGAIIWAAFLPLAGYYLGKIVPIEDLEKMFLVPVISVIVMLIVVPTLVHIYKDKKKQKKDDTAL